MACSLTPPEKKKTSQNQKEKKLVSNSYDKVMFGHFLGRGASIHVAVAWKDRHFHNKTHTHTHPSAFTSPAFIAEHGIM